MPLTIKEKKQLQEYHVMQCNQEFRAKWRMIRKKCDTLCLWNDADCDYYEYNLDFDPVNRTKMPFFKELYLEFEVYVLFIRQNYKQIDSTHIRSVLGYVKLFIEKMSTQTLIEIQKRSGTDIPNKTWVIIHLNTLKKELEKHLQKKQQLKQNKEKQNATNRGCIHYL